MNDPAPTRSRPSPRQAAAAVVLAGGLVGGAFAFAPDGAGAAPEAPTTAVVEARDLEVTDDEAGTLARADTTTVVYDGTGGRVGGGPAGSQVTAQSTDDATVAQIAPTQEPSSTTSPSTSSTTSTTAPAVRPPSQTIPSTVPSTVPNTVPDDTTPDATLPPDDGQQLPDDGSGGPVVGGPSADGADGGDGELPQEGGGASSATLTELLPIGSQATRGSVLYRADDEPIVALLAATPLFRDLTVGVEGPDVAALEANLVELGFGSGLDVDEEFDAATAAAVKAWEEHLGRATPDGVVTVGEVQLLAEPTSVLGHEVAVGDLLEPGDAVMVLGAESRVVETDVLAEDATDWSVGTTVGLDWGDGTTGTGTITEVARDVVEGEVALVVTIADGAGADRPIGSRVKVVRTVAERPGAISVPVAAVVAGEDGPAVRVVTSAGDVLTAVELGIVDDGWVEILDGLDEGAEVRLPG